MSLRNRPALFQVTLAGRCGTTTSPAARSPLARVGTAEFAFVAADTQPLAVDTVAADALAAVAAPLGLTVATVAAPAEVAGTPTLAAVAAPGDDAAVSGGGSTDTAAAAASVVTGATVYKASGADEVPAGGITVAAAVAVGSGEGASAVAPVTARLHTRLRP